MTTKLRIEYLGAACGVLMIAHAACGGDGTTFGDPGGAGNAGDGGSGAATGGTTSDGGSGGGATGGGGEGGGAQPCSWSPDSNECGDGFYCNAPDCVSGTCASTVVDPDSVKVPVCGCDNVNYWNANTAAQFGMPVASSGECAMPETCAKSTINGKACPQPEHDCAELRENLNGCAVDPNGIARGRCWGMPEICPTRDADWRPCTNGTILGCVGECAAIKGDGIYWADASCQ